MAFVLTTTTESAEALRAAAASDSSWKTPPPEVEKPPDPGDVPKDMPQRIFNELREEAIAAKKKAGPALFAGEEERTRDVASAIKKYEVAKERDRKAEAQRRELRPILESVTGERFSDESQSSESPQPSAERNGNGNGNGNAADAAPSNGYDPHFARAMYRDFDEAIAASDRAGVRISAELQAAIRAVNNPSEIAHIVYGLAKNPEWVAELEADPTQLARISPTVRHNQLSYTHQERMRAAQKADPDGVAAVAAATDVPIAPAVRMAILEQDNSDALVMHFARNPEVLEELNDLPPSAAMSRVGRIAAQLEAKSAVKQRVRAPEPISPVGQSSTRSGISLEEMSPRDYIRTRNKQEYERKRFGR